MPRGLFSNFSHQAYFSSQDRFIQLSSHVHRHWKPTTTVHQAYNCRDGNPPAHTKRELNYDVLTVLYNNSYVVKCSNTSK